MSFNPVICFGEVLWDLLPDGKQAGGAPMNVAFHLNNLGVLANVISRVGNDELGNELLDFLDAKGIPCEFISQDEELPTSIVKVELDKFGHAQYEIVQPVAWDNIPIEANMVNAVKASELLVFGSLASRTKNSKNTLMQLLEASNRSVFDVNLRPPFYNKVLLEDLMTKSSIVKLNNEELTEIASWYTTSTLESKMLKALKERFNLEGVLLTRGKNGAAYLHNSSFNEHQGFKVKVIDTVGSGDSFLGSFLAMMLKGHDPKSCLEFACAMGALMATKKGGTSTIYEEDVVRFIKENK